MISNFTAFGDTICSNNNILVAIRIMDYVDKGLDYQLASWILTQDIGEPNYGKQLYHGTPNILPDILWRYKLHQ